MHSPEEHDFYGKTLEEALPRCLVWLMAPEPGIRPFLVGVPAASHEGALRDYRLLDWQPVVHPRILAREPTHGCTPLRPPCPHADSRKQPALRPRGALSPGPDGSGGPGRGGHPVWSTGDAACGAAIVAPAAAYANGAQTRSSAARFRTRASARSSPISAPSPSPSATRKARALTVGAT